MDAPTEPKQMTLGSEIPSEAATKPSAVSAEMFQPTKSKRLVEGDYEKH